MTEEAKGDYIRLREENIKRNQDFLTSIGAPTITGYLNSSSLERFEPTTTKGKKPKAIKAVSSVIKGNQRVSVRQRTQRDQRKNKEDKREKSQNLRCLYCQNDPNGLDHTYYDHRGLSIHQISKNCSKNKKIVNKAFENSSKQQELQRKVYRVQDEIFQDLDCFSLPESNGATYLNNEENSSSCFDNSHLLERNILDEDTDLNNICQIYYVQQRTVFDLIFGIDSVICSSLETFINLVRQKKGNFMDHSGLICSKLYSILSSKVSRSTADDLLDIINIVKDIRWRIPRTYYGLSASVNAEVDKIYKFKTLTVPWIDSWGMEAFPDFPRIKIYYRSPLELISYLFLDPEIMFVWKEHIKFSYSMHTNNNKEEVISNLMTSPWARDTENEIRIRDPNGFIMPLIFYSDGVQVGTNTHHKVTTVICSTGNFSDSLLNKEFSKCVVAYLPNFNQYSKYDLQKHLIQKMKFSKSKAKKEIQKFELLVERTFWRTIVDEVNYCWNNGIRLYTLGLGERIFYPCISFFCGDDPSQHRICGLFEGICKHGCTYCNYPTINGGVYNSTNPKHFPRDINKLTEACNEAELISIKMSDNVLLDKNEKQIIKDLTAQSVHPYKNPFHDAPMGVGGNIYKSTPPDLLHLFCSGLMKVVAGWILTIIISLSNQTGFNNNMSTFDSRIHDFPSVINMPHLNWQKFKGGIMKFARKNKREKEQATGSFGGFRSSSFVSILFQIYYSIGFKDDVLPGAANFEFDTDKGKIKLGNVRAKVQNTIASILDSYFDCKRKEWTSALSDDFQNKLNNMYVHIKLLWELNQTTLNPFQSPKGNKMRNIHKHLHLPLYTRWLGSLGKVDTSTYESFHKISTTGIWEKTSRRNDTLFVEMTRKMISVRHNRLKDFFSKAICQENDKYVQSLTMAIPNVVIFKALTNQTSFEFYISHNKKTIILEENVSWQQICNQSCFRKMQQFYDMLIECDYENLLEEQYGITKSSQTGLYDYNMYFIKGFTYSSGEDSQMGSGTIYATPKYNNNTKYANYSDKPRYDYVYINSNNNALTLVKILVMFELKLPKSKIIDKQEETKMCLVVQHLTKAHPKHERNVTIGACYTWAHAEENDKIFSYDVITIQSIVRPAFVVPDFSNHSNLINSHYGDIYYVLDRIYFDRSGWEVPRALNNVDYVHTLEQQNAYIIANQTLSILAKQTLKTDGKKKDGNMNKLNEYHQINDEEIEDSDVVLESEEEDGDEGWSSVESEDEDEGL